MSFQCAPEPDDVIAQRRLSDGRRLCVFRLWTYSQRSVHERAGYYEYIAGEVIVRMRRESVSMQTTRRFTGFSLSIEDDQGMPEKWRSLERRRSRVKILQAFNDFKEGNDDRRKGKRAEHPNRRAEDRA